MTGLIILVSSAKEGQRVEALPAAGPGGMANTKEKYGVSAVAQRKPIRLGTMRLWVQSLASLSGLRIWLCRELWCRSQIRLRSGVLWLWCRPAAIAPIRPLAWEPNKRQKQKQKQKQKTNVHSFPPRMAPEH